MIATLQSLRFVFVMLIFLSHFAYKDIQALDAGGDCGVAFFFILSGFGCSLGYGSKLRDGSFRYAAFLWRRIRKCYPLHLLCLAAFLLLSHAAIDGKVLLNVLLLQSWVPDADWYFSCNSVAWFLSSLLFCYVVFPWAYRWLSPALTVTVVAACITVYLLTPYDHVNAVLYVHPLVRFIDFYWGMLLARCYDRWQSQPRTEMLLLVLLLAALALYPIVDAKVRNAPLFWIVLLPLIGVFAQQRGWLSRLLQTRTMLWLGSLTMPLFLTHQMMIPIVQHHLPDMPAIAMLAACLLVSLTVSWGVQTIFSRLLRL